MADYDEYKVNDTSGGINQNWLIAIGSVRHKQDLAVMDDDALEDLLFGKLDYSASIKDRVLNISVWDLTPEAYITRLGFSQAEKDWATLLYSVMAEDQRVTVGDTDGSGYYGTDYGDITFTNAETPVVYYNQTDVRWGNKPYSKTSTIGRDGKQLVEAGEGVNLSFTFKRQPKEKILSKIAQTTMVNRSRMRDVGDTRQDFEELDSAISSGLYLKDAMNRQGEDFYYMHTLLEITAEDAETLEQRVTAVEKLCVSIDMIARRCDYKNEQAFLSILPLLALDPDVERKSRRNALTSGVAAAPPERARPSHSGVWADGCVQEMVKTIRGLGGIAATSTQGMQDLFGLDGGKYGKGILDSSRIKLVMQMEEQEARLIQGVLNLSEDEVRQITRFRRGEGLLCVGYNHVPVQFHATEKEYDAITTCPTSTIWPLCSASGWIRPKPSFLRGRVTGPFTKF